MLFFSEAVPDTLHERDFQANRPAPDDNAGSTVRLSHGVILGFVINKGAGGTGLEGAWITKFMADWYKYPEQSTVDPGHSALITPPSNDTVLPIRLLGSLEAGRTMVKAVELVQ